MYDIRVYSSHSFSLVLDCVLPCSVSRGAANRPTNQSGFSPNRGSNPVTLIVLLSVLPALALKTYCCLPLLSSRIFSVPFDEPDVHPWGELASRFDRPRVRPPLHRHTFNRHLSTREQTSGPGHRAFSLRSRFRRILHRHPRPQGTSCTPSLEVEVKLD